MKELLKEFALNRIGRLITIFLLVGIIVVSYNVRKSWSGYFEKVSVTGTIYGKSDYDTYHKRHATEHWRFAVKPDNPNWKKFDIEVSFSTFCSYNIGDRITFPNLSKSIVEPVSTGIHNGYALLDWAIWMAVPFLVIMIFVLIPEQLDL